MRRSWKHKLRRLLRKQNKHVLASFTVMVLFWCGCALVMQWGMSNVVDVWLSNAVYSNWRP